MFIRFVQYFLGAVFIVSAVSKLVATGVFEISIIEQGIAGDRQIAGYLARLLIGFELFLGASCFFSAGLKRLILPLILATLTGFTLYLAYFALFRTEMEDCGCFGEMVRMTPFESILKNLVLIAMTVLVLVGTPVTKVRWAASAAVLAVCTIAVFVYSPVRPVHTTQFSGYTSFSGFGVVDLNKGEKLVAVFNLDCEHCQQTAYEMGLLYKENHKKLPELFCLIMGEPEQVDPFFKKAQSGFPYRMISENEFFSLIGNEPPRIYRLLDGRIKDTWDRHFTMNISKAYLE